MKFIQSEFTNNLKFNTKIVLVLILINISKILASLDVKQNQNITIITDEKSNNELTINKYKDKINWEKLNSTMINLISILDSLMESSDKNKEDRDVLALEFIKKNRELQDQLSFLERNKNFVSKRRNYKTILNSNLNNQNVDKFKTNIEIKANSFNENQKEDRNKNIFFIENKNSFSSGDINNMNEFNLQIQFSNINNKYSNFEEKSLNIKNSNEIPNNQLSSIINSKKNDQNNSDDFTKEKKILRKLKNNNFFGLSYLEFILKDKYRFAKNIECNKYNCFSPNICLDGNFCKCGEEYANFYDNSNNKENSPERFIFCNYKRKKQIITFMLEFFLFFGMGHVYAGNYIIGITKFIFFVLIIVIKLRNKKNPKEIENDEDENSKKKINWLHLLTLLLAVIWYLVDIIFLALSKYADGNGVPMLSW